MIEQGLGPRGIDTTTPNIARIYDYLLGGKDNFAADREAAEQLIAAVPYIAGIARDNRAFIARVVRYLAGEAGIRQFLDLGAGLPAQASVHELAHQVAPDARVVYVDNDPVVCSHGQALLGSRDRVAMVLGDLRQPAEILQDPGLTALLDLSQPVAVVCAAALHFVPDEEQPHQIIAGYRDQLAPGSYLAISHGSTGTPDNDPADTVQSVTNIYQNASAHLHVRPLPQVRRFFDGYELVDPGVVWMTSWRPDPDTSPAGLAQSLLAGLGRQP